MYHKIKTELERLNETIASTPAEELWLVARRVRGHDSVVYIRYNWPAHTWTPSLRSAMPLPYKNALAIARNRGATVVRLLDVMNYWADQNAHDRVEACLSCNLDKAQTIDKTRSERAPTAPSGLSQSGQIASMVPTYPRP